MKKRDAIAAAIMAGLILVSLPLGAQHSLEELREDAEGLFYYDRAGYSIYDGIEKRTEAAQNLITVANRYTTAHTELTPYVDELDYQLRTLGNIFDYDTDSEGVAANYEMGQVAENLAHALEAIDLEEKDEKYPAQLIAQMQSEQDKISRSGYNDAARSFNDKLYSFPISLLRPFTGVKALCVFDENPVSGDRDIEVEMTDVVEAVEGTAPLQEDEGEFMVADDDLDTDTVYEETERP